MRTKINNSRAWAYSAAYRNNISTIRKLNTRNQNEDGSYSLSNKTASNRGISNMMVEELWRMTKATLSTEEFDIIQMTTQNYSNDEIESRLGYNKNKIYKIRCAARKKLASAFNQAGYEV